MPVVVGSQVTNRVVHNPPTINVDVQEETRREVCCVCGGGGGGGTYIYKFRGRCVHVYMLICYTHTPESQSSCGEQSQ